MELFEAIKKRRSIRRFKDTIIDIDLIRQMIQMGTFAPTACNRQGWRFVIVTDKSLMNAMRERGGSPVIAAAPAGILVLYNRFTRNPEYPDNTESASACIQNMLLTATQLHLGTCWINHLPPKSELYKMFHIPKRYDIIAYIAVGYPDHSPGEKLKKYTSVEELISLNRFEMSCEIEKRSMSRIFLFFLTVLRRIYFQAPGFLTKSLKKPLRKLREKEFFKIDHDE